MEQTRKSVARFGRPRERRKTATARAPAVPEKHFWAESGNIALRPEALQRLYPIGADCP